MSNQATTNDIVKNQIADLKNQYQNIGLQAPERPNGMSNIEYKDFLIKGLADAGGDPGAAAGNGKEPPPLNVDSHDAPEVMALIAQLKKDLDEEREARRNMNEQVDALLRSASFKGKSQDELSQNPEYLGLIERMSRGNTSASGLISSDYVRPEDRIEPVTFVAVKKFGPLTFREEGGVRISPPTGTDKIRFTPVFRYVVNNQRLTFRAVFTTESKLVAEFVRKHEKFGVEIYEDEKDIQALNSNSEWADIRDQHLIALNIKPDHVIFQMAREQQPPINFGSTTDIVHLRKLVAERMANDTVRQARAQAQVEDERRVGQNLLMKNFKLPIQETSPESMGSN